MYLRLGRLVLRGHRPHVMWLPSGYRSPLVAYLVEWTDERDGSTAQLGGFTTRREAEACVTELESEGWRELHINVVAVHERHVDWRWDR